MGFGGGGGSGGGVDAHWHNSQSDNGGPLQLKNDITVIIKEILELKGYVNEVVTPFITSTRNIFEQYLVYKGDVEKFTEHIQKEYSDEKGTNNKSPKKRPRSIQ